MTLSNIRKNLDEKKISSYELTKIYIENIKKYNSEINCYITICEDFALQSAKKAQKLIDDKKSSNMTGIPISIKDNICTKGIKTTCASKILKDFIPDYNATVINKILNENAVILGKTNLDEFGMGDSNQNSYYGAVKNPYNKLHISGGSSGGSAASVAANMAPVSLGTDTGGSVRQPAVHCGVTGLRPTYGTVSRYGLIAFASSLDQIGICAKSAEDTGYLLNSIYGIDKNDLTTSSYATGDYLKYINKPIKNLKIGIIKEFMNNITSDDVKNSILTAIDYFKKNGAEIVEASLPSSKFLTAAYLAISSAEACTNLAKFDGVECEYNNINSFEETLTNTRTDGFGKEVKKRILLGNYLLSDENYQKFYKSACDVRKQIVFEYNKIFEDCDVILSPTTFSTARRINFPGNNIEQKYSQDIFTVSASLAGLPEISTTCGYDNNNLPIGFSLTGKQFDDAKIISLANMFEKDFSRKEPVL